MHDASLKPSLYRSLEMSSLLPPNSTKLEKVLEQVSARIDQLPVPFVQLNRIDDCPEKYLPWLAWEHRVEYWRPDWTLVQKRQAITSAKTFNAQRGTKASLKALIDTVIDDYQIKAWHETTPKGQPYTFTVIVSQQNFLTIDQLAQLHTAVDATKSQRDLYAIDAKLITKGSITICGVGSYAEYIQLESKEN